MPWFVVDDTLHSHPKVRRAGAAAVGVWVAGSWCADHLMDGIMLSALGGKILAEGVV